MEVDVIVDCKQCLSSIRLLTFSTCCGNIYCLPCRKSIIQTKKDCPQCASIHGFRSMPCFTTAIRTRDMLHPTYVDNCRLHFNRPITHFCRVCREFLCQFCVDEDHLQHGTRRIDTYYDLSRFHLDNSIALITELLSDLDKSGGTLHRDSRLPKPKHTSADDLEGDRTVIQCTNYDYQIQY
jgi:B-box zinc finger